MHFKLEYIQDWQNDATEFPLSKTITTEFHMDEAAPWTDVMDQFVMFLGSCYGYDISKDIEYKTFRQKLQALKSDLDDDEEDEYTEGREFN